MKFKKGLVAIFISIIILTVSTNVFALTSSKKTTKAKNEISNSVKNETKSKAKNEVENTTKNNSKNQITNTTKNTTKDNSKSSTNTTKKKSTTTKTTENDNILNREVINKDVSNFEAVDDLEYTNVRINGNVFIACANKVILDDIYVDGDIMLFANEVEIKDIMVNGSVYLASDNISVKNSKILSLYSAGNDITIEDDTIVTRELKAVGSKIIFDGEARRDFCAIGSTVRIKDNAVVEGTAYIRSESKSISKNASIDDLDYEEVKYNKDNQSNEISEDFVTYAIDKGIELAIILLVAIFLLCGFPKFVEANSSLKLRNFFKAFFTGLLEILVIIAIAIGLCATGYGFGYGLLLLNLLFTFLLLGKMIFVICFAIRLSCSPEKISKVKAFFATVLVGVILALIEMISFAGSVGAIVDIIINVVLAITGLGSLFRVIFTPKKQCRQECNVIKMDNNNNNSSSNNNNNSAKSTTVEPVKAEPTTVNQSSVFANVEDSGQAEIQKEVKEEIKQEVQELKEEREEEKKLEEKENETKPKKETEPKAKKEESKTSGKTEKKGTKTENNKKTTSSKKTTTKKSTKKDE